ncbi:hypothetical protein EJB05_51351, partial [Eragrostis curvula]
MVGILKEGLGVGCIYSWLSSHYMQRATVTGLPAEAVFRTPAMEAMVQGGPQAGCAQGSTMNKEGRPDRLSMSTPSGSWTVSTSDSNCGGKLGGLTCPTSSSWTISTKMMRPAISLTPPFNAIMQWQSTSNPGKKTHGHGPDQ